MVLSFLNSEILTSTFISIFLTLFGLGIGFALLKLQTGLGIKSFQFN